MRVCFVFKYFDRSFGGVSRVMWELGRRLDAEVHVITSRRGGEASLELVDGISVHRVAAFDFLKIPVPLPKLFGLSVIKKIKSINPDVVVAFDTTSFFTLAALAGKIVHRKPVVLSVHSIDRNYANPLLNALLFFYHKLFKLLLPLADYTTATMESSLLPLNPKKIIPNAVDPARFKPADASKARAKLGLPQDKKIVVFAGRIIPIKGVKYLIEAARAVPDAQFVAVGEGHLKGRIIKDAPSIIVCEPSADIQQYFQAADACLIPSLSEGFCLTALEAYACGTPIVGSHTGIIPKLTEHAFDVGDVDGMVEGLKKVLDGAKGRKEFKVKDWGEVAREYERVFKKILK